jgi:hypothetical protein
MIDRKASVIEVMIDRKVSVIEPTCKVNQRHFRSARGASRFVCLRQRYNQHGVRL